MTDLALLGTELCYCWETAPDAPSGESADAPAVFRWIVREPGDDGRVVELFVGETSRLGSPGASCSGPESTDCCTTHESLRAHRNRGHDIRLEILRFTHFEIAGHRIFPTSLKDGSLRRLLTNLFAFQFAQEGHRVLAA